MRGWRHGPQRRPPQDVLRDAIIEQVGQIGASAVELAHAKWPLRPFQAPAQVIGQARLVEALVRAHFADVVVSLSRFGNHSPHPHTATSVAKFARQRPIRYCGG